MNQPAPSRGALDGVRVLDLTRLLPGPMASLILADMGAQVDKLEDPAPGDYLRNFPPMRGAQSGAYRIINRDKRNLVVDLKHPDGKALLRRLIPRYDVILEGFRPGVMSRLGASHEEILAINPRAVVCAITGYGQTGPLAHRAGHDINYLARAGVLGVTGPADGAPAVSGVQMADVAGGAMWAVISVLGALLERQRTGRGRVCDISMCEGALPLAAFALSAQLTDGVGTPRGASTLDGGIAPYNTYLTRDGRAVALGALEPKFLLNFAAGVGLDITPEALLAGEHQTALRATFSALFAARTLAEWVEFGTHHDCCIEPVLTPSELVSDPQHVAREVFFSLDDGEGQPLTHFRTPVGVAQGHSPARDAGADTDAVLREAGVSDDELRALREARVIQ